MAVNILLQIDSKLRFWIDESAIGFRPKAFGIDPHLD